LNGMSRETLSVIFCVDMKLLRDGHRETLSRLPTRHEITASPHFHYRSAKGARTSRGLPFASNLGGIDYAYPHDTHAG